MIRRGSTPDRRAGISVMEIVLGALILGVSGVAVLELMRSSTSNLEVTEIEAVARGLAADTLERYSHQAMFDGPRFARTTERMMGVPLPWSQLVGDDPSLRYGFPREQLSQLLDLHDVRLTLKLTRPYPSASFGRAGKMSAIEVTAHWTDGPGRGASRGSTSDYKTVTYACLLEL